MSYTYYLCDLSNGKQAETEIDPATLGPGEEVFEGHEPDPAVQGKVYFYLRHVVSYRKISSDDDS